MAPLLLFFLPLAATGDLEHFEREIRPVLVERCYRCHNSVDVRRGGLALDHAAGLLLGGDRGPAIVPGDADASLLMRAVRHAEGAPAMPEGEPVLEPRELAAFATWIAGGAPDPRDAPPTAEALAAETSWEAIRERRLAWWSFQPVTDPPPPPVGDAAWPLDPLDRFVLAALEARGERPRPDLDRAALLRRASFVLTGLPPTPYALATFLADGEPDAYARAVDRLLASPHYGERLARRWMDLFRYAETHGSEGDPGVPNAWRYRDYLIRAFEADVPWDRLVQEHVAGDLVSPRIDLETGVNEAELGLGHFRFVQHGYAPTEPLVDQVQFIDNQVDVLTKSVLGLTVSCARCHDHKFDPVSQADYYGLYGVLASARAAVRTVDGEETRNSHVPELAALKPEIRAALADAWRAAVPALGARMSAPGPAMDEAREALKAGRPHPLAPWVAVLDGANPAEEWARHVGEMEPGRARLRAAGEGPRWDLSGPDAETWYAHGSVLEARASRPGDFAVWPSGEIVISTLLPAGVYSHLLSNKHSGVLSSPSFDVPGGTLWIRAMGGGGARARYAMQLHPRVSGPTYRAHDPNAPTPRWLRWDMSYWAGDRAHLELATARDIPVEAREQERSWWGITEARIVPPGAPEPRDEAVELLQPLLESVQDPPRNTAELLGLYLATVEGAIQRWKADDCSDADARFLDPFVRFGLLPVDLGTLERVAPLAVPLVRRYRELEAQVPVPTRAPGILPSDRIDQPLFTRGDRRQPEAPVPQRFLEFLDDTPYVADGRLALARDLVRDDNPLPARVAANRLWTWVFGDGLVSSVDNLGLLGSEPRDPALLDHLATRFVTDGWSVKRFLRALVTSRTFRQVQEPRRLDAESVRDALLAVSGRLEPARFGPPSDERGARRSVYVSQRRTALPPLLATFDQPPPNTTVGRRAATNVPAQALALLNDPLVADCARVWAETVLRASGTDAERVRGMFVRALAREATEEELARARAFLAASREAYAAAVRRAEQLDAALAAADTRLAELFELGRMRALAARSAMDDLSEKDLSARSALAPLARWEFDGDLRDEVGGLHGEAFGRVRLEGGYLVLDGGGHVRTAPLERELSAKTLEAWVALETLDQSGSGVIGVQTNDGHVFDGIVFAERQPRRWISGSDSFRRTQDVDGEDEVAGLVHVAITYGADGTITLYRDGVSYGAPYAADGPVRFAAGAAHVILGARHGDAGAPRGPLRGSLERAQLHGRALAPEEVAASAAGDPNFVSRGEARDALDAGERAELDELEARLGDLRARRSAQEPALDGGPDRAWRELAHALFQLEEFRYLR